LPKIEKRHLAIGVLITLMFVLVGVVMLLSTSGLLFNSDLAIHMDNINGTWAGTVHNSNGGQSYYILVLTQNGTSVTGQAQAQNDAGSGYAQVRGSYSGNLLSLEEYNPTGTGWSGICNWRLNLHTIGSLNTPQMTGKFVDIQNSDGYCNNYGTVVLDRR
jgi:hypothetical protein